MDHPFNEQPDARDRPSQPGPFHAFEQGRGAVFGEEADCGVAIRYSQPDRGLVAARTFAAIADLTPMARIEVSGKDRSALLQRISTNDLRPLKKGSLAPTIFVTPKGRIVDRVFVLDRGESLLLLAAQGGRVRVQDWIRKYTLSDDVRLRDLTGETAAFGLTGPGAEGLVRAIVAWSPEPLDRGGFLETAEGEGWAIAAPLDFSPAAGRSWDRALRSSDSTGGRSSSASRAGSRRSGSRSRRS